MRSPASSCVAAERARGLLQESQVLAACVGFVTAVAQLADAEVLQVQHTLGAGA